MEDDDDDIEIMFDTDINTVVKMMTMMISSVIIPSQIRLFPNNCPTVFVDNKTKSNCRNVPMVFMNGT